MPQLNHNWFAQLPIKNIETCQPVSGGDINLAYQITADGKIYFIKVQPNHHADYFKHEINGLKALGKAVNTPTPLYNGEIDGHAYLVLNWLDETFGDQRDLGHAVAKLHLQTNDKFGFVDNHQTKALVKDNSWNDDWVDFYVHQRLLPEVRTAMDKGVWNDWREQQFQKMVSKFEEVTRQRDIKPSLLHGDLWAGNFLFAGDHEPYLIDPDAVYGDREFDLAMTTVFGGFDREFYQGYGEVYPLDDGINERLDWYRFYYLCMHLILFGESYGTAVDRILEQY
ncbi:MAG: fructosamine kinase family protein [Limosilactobacillus sp.]|uniref:fructosamine kinase family protein n=1 Tax=Limosilactobacillus sp. TaxID=2773925 RepID=UPI002707E215|nr:fructosamine kinase family protein [Limosilactobacillus sp.]